MFLKPNCGVLAILLLSPLSGWAAIESRNSGVIAVKSGNTLTLTDPSGGKRLFGFPLIAKYVERELRNLEGRRTALLKTLAGIRATPDKEARIANHATYIEHLRIFRETVTPLDQAVKSKGHSLTGVTQKTAVASDRISQFNTQLKQEQSKGSPDPEEVRKLQANVVLYAQTILDLKKEQEKAEGELQAAKQAATEGRRDANAKFGLMRNALVKSEIEKIESEIASVETTQKGVLKKMSQVLSSENFLRALGNPKLVYQSASLSQEEEEGWLAVVELLEKPFWAMMTASEWNVYSKEGPVERIGEQIVFIKLDGEGVPQMTLLQKDVLVAGNKRADAWVTYRFDLDRWDWSVKKTDPEGASPRKVVVSIAPDKGEMSLNVSDGESKVLLDWAASPSHREEVEAYKEKVRVEQARNEMSHLRQQAYRWRYPARNEKEQIANLIEGVAEPRRAAERAARERAQDIRTAEEIVGRAKKIHQYDESISRDFRAIMDLIYGRER